MNIKIINATILNLDEKTVLQNMAVCIENDIISFVGENDNLFVKAFQEDKLLDFQGDILSAGFINAHSHNAMTLFRGLKDDAPLQEWLFENMFVIEKHLTPNDVFFGTQLGLLESIKSGITTNLDAYFFPEEIVKAKGWIQISDESAIKNVVMQVLEANPQSIADYRAGKDRALGFLVGQAMKATKGQANPQMLNQMFLDELNK